MNRKHREKNCNVPFCSECWKTIKGNINGLMKVADNLRVKPTERSDPKPKGKSK